MFLKMLSFKQFMTSNMASNIVAKSINEENHQDFSNTYAILNDILSHSNPKAFTFTFKDLILGTTISFKTTEEISVKESHKLVDIEKVKKLKNNDVAKRILEGYHYSLSTSVILYNYKAYKLLLNDYALKTYCNDEWNKYKKVLDNYAELLEIC